MTENEHVTLNDLFTDDFMRDNTSFSDFQAMIQSAANNRVLKQAKEEAIKLLGLG